MFTATYSRHQRFLRLPITTASAASLAFVLFGASLAVAEDAKAKAGDKPKENLGQRREGEVGKNEELGFQQSKVSSQMSELEERMFRLSDALKTMEPENASRLLMGLKYAREELIQLQMKEIQSALNDKKYNDALADQKELLAKLRRLEQLLLSPDLDFQLQLERLRLMRDLMRRLDAAIQEEQREKTASDQSAEAEEKLKELRKKLAMLGELIQRQTDHTNSGKEIFGEPETPNDGSPADALNASSPAVPKEKPSAEAMESLVANQAETREKTKALEEASEHIAGAGRKMQQATEQLKGDRPASAVPSQTDALSLLKKAQEAMQAEERELEQSISEQKFAELKKDQANNRKATDGINEAAVQLGDAGVAARADMTKAAGSMMNAEGSLGGREADSASGSQSDAIDSLKRARQKLEEEEQRLLSRLRGEIKKRTIEGIIQMLEGQIVIRQSTERLGPRVANGGRTVLNSITGLAASEGKLVTIGESLTSLVEETEFGIALPAALRSITDGMTDVKERLAKTDASPEVIAAEKQIEEDLQTLLDAMKQLPSSTGGNGNGNQRGRSDRERQLNQIIAELKMLRMLQVRVGRDTKDVDGQRPAESQELTANLAKRIEALQGRQEDVFDVTERIALERGDDLPEIPE